MNSAASHYSQPLNSVSEPIVPASNQVSHTRMHRAARRKQLLEVASEVFAASGFHQSAMDEIAVRAGISKPVLYQHFPSKINLYTAVISSHVDNLIASLKQALHSTKNVKERFYNSVKIFFDFAHTEGQAYKLIFRSDNSVKEIYEVINNAFEECVSLVQDFVEADTDMYPAEHRIVALTLVRISQTNAVHWMESSQQMDQEKAISLTSSMAWGAYLQARSTCTTNR